MQAAPLWAFHCNRGHAGVKAYYGAAFRMVKGLKISGWSQKKHFHVNTSMEKSEKLIKPVKWRLWWGNLESTPKRMISIKIDAEGIFGPELTNC